MTYARFFVQGDPPDDFRASYMRNVRHRAMRPLEPDEEELERSGWCKVGEPMEIELGHDDVFYNEYIVLGFRTDRWAIPGPVMRTRMREAEQAYLQKKGREKLSRKEKAELKLFVAKKLRKTMAPLTRHVDVVWSMNEGLVRFYSHATKPALAMSDLFAKTFGVKLVPESPYTAADRMKMGAPFADLEPTYLASP